MKIAQHELTQSRWSIPCSIPYSGMQRSAHIALCRLWHAIVSYHRAQSQSCSSDDSNFRTSYDTTIAVRHHPHPFVPMAAWVKVHVYSGLLDLPGMSVLRASRYWSCFSPWSSLAAA